MKHPSLLTANSICVEYKIFHENFNHFDTTKLDKASCYYSYIHSYINHANITWCSTFISNTKKPCRQQKHAVFNIYMDL